MPLWLQDTCLKKIILYRIWWSRVSSKRCNYIDDVCNIILIQIKKLKKINNDTFNIGGGTKSYISLKDLTAKCEKLTKNRIIIKKVPKTSVFDIPYFITNNSKVKNV